MASYELVEKLKREIAALPEETEFESVGAVIEAGDGIARIRGLRTAASQEVLSIEGADGPVPALAANLEEDHIGAIILGESEKIAVGNRVRQTGKILSVRAGEEMLGRVVSGIGEPLDGKGALFSSDDAAEEYSLERKAPGVLDRESVGTPMHTGIMAVDALIPIGRGQRELIIGDRKTGKTAIALDAILNQQHDKARKPVVCIYVAVGQKNADIATLTKKLENNGALDYTVIVSAPAASPAALRYLAPYTGTAIGEYFMDRGKDVLVVYDDLTKHANAYRELSLLLKRPPGREAYPGDIFYLHSRLLERAAELDEAHGGGSLTALPIIETQLGDVSAYIPTNVISITDGQIYLEENLFHRGQRPAVNVGLSVSRVGSSAQTKAMKKVAGNLRLELAQFRELQAFVQFASDLDDATKEKIRRGELLTETLKQTDGNPRPVEREVTTLYAALNGYADGIELSEISRFTEELWSFLESMHKDDVLAPLANEGVLSEEVEENLKQALASFKQSFASRTNA